MSTTKSLQEAATALCAIAARFYHDAEKLRDPGPITQDADGDDNDYTFSIEHGASAWLRVGEYLLWINGESIDIYDGLDRPLASPIHRITLA